MPALPSVSKVVRVDVNYSIYSDTNSKDRFFFQYTGAGPSAADLITFLNTCITSWGTNIKPLCSAFVATSTWQATDLTSPSAPQSIVASAVSGTRAGTAMAGGIAAVCRFKIARRYRGGHPRIYWPAGMAGDITAGGIWSGGFQNSISAGTAAFIAACVAAPPASMGTVTHVNVSYFQGFTNKTFPSGRIKPVPTLRGTPAVDSVIAYVANPKVASQRRRNLEHG